MRDRLVVTRGFTLAFKGDPDRLLNSWAVRNDHHCLIAGEPGYTHGTSDGGHGAAGRFLRLRAFAAPEENVAFMAGPAAAWPHVMLPIVSPWLLALSVAARRRSPGPAPFTEVGGFLLGYGAVWVGYSVLAAGGQMLLQRMALLSSEGTLTSPFVGSALLAVAGVYQWTPFRDSCMTHCRSPFAYFLSDWRAGSWGAFFMSARHGIYCAGCCWALMALSLVFGVMSLAWMGVLTAFLLLEKVTSAGPWLGRTAGALLLAGAVWLLVA